MTVLAHDAAPTEPSVAATRLLVTRRGPDQVYRAVGFLSCLNGGSYRFDYLKSAVDRPDFQPLPGFSRTDSPYLSASLFPVFAERVMSSRRPDRRETLAALDLPEDAAPFEVLVRSGGRSVGDAVELLLAPDLDSDGHLSLDFLVHGVRHMTRDAQGRITTLRSGETLYLQVEPDNPVNPRAQLVADDAQTRLGYVPDPLIPIIEQMSDPVASVIRANGADLGFHFRLRVRVSGEWMSGEPPFAGHDWQLST